MHKKTNVYCPSCREITPCEVISRSAAKLKGGQRWKHRAFADVQWFERVRQCTCCDHRFTTAELSRDFISELVALREYCISVDAEVRAIPAALESIQDIIKDAEGTMRIIDSHSRAIEPRLLKAKGARSANEAKG